MLNRQSSKTSITDAPILERQRTISFAESDHKSRKTSSTSTINSNDNNYIINNNNNNNNSEYFNPEVQNRSNTKEVYRRILRELYEEEEKGKKKTTEEVSTDGKIEESNETVEIEDRWVLWSNFSKMLDKVATEHENLLTLVIFSPLILTALYIFFIEGSPLVITKR